MCSGGVGRGGEAGVPARFPRVEPGAVVVVAEEHVDEGVVGVRVGERQKTAVKEARRGESQAEESSSGRRI